MNVLLDHCTPKQFGFLLTGHFVRTARFMGWDNLQNGNLLQAAIDAFEVMVTVDTRLEFQQHLSALPLPVITLVVPSNRMVDVAPLASKTLALLSSSLEKRIYHICAEGWNPRHLA